MTREEYFQLMEMLRPRVSDCLGVCPVVNGRPSYLKYSCRHHFCLESLLSFRSHRSLWKRRKPLLRKRSIRWEVMPLEHSLHKRWRSWSHRHCQTTLQVKGLDRCTERYRTSLWIPFDTHEMVLTLIFTKLKAISEAYVSESK